MSKNYFVEVGNKTEKEIDTIFRSRGMKIDLTVVASFLHYPGCTCIFYGPTDDWTGWGSGTVSGYIKDGYIHLKDIAKNVIGGKIK